ncbi:MAG: roadblock/LC7 domain-containing protein [Thermodesulfobacteria bacterium]|nr:roadblock/LC7 domain-containing protein [Thermodesulfobacteriota bacterium]
MADLVLTGPALEKAKSQINEALIEAGVHTALLIDQAGNVVASCGKNRKDLDVTSLAALAAANFGATSQMAKLIGEDDFSLLFHKGKRDSIHFAKVGDELILVTIFGDDVSLGLVRLRVAELTNSIDKIFGQGN